MEDRYQENNENTDDYALNISALQAFRLLDKIEIIYEGFLEKSDFRNQYLFYQFYPEADWCFYNILPFIINGEKAGSLINYVTISVTGCISTIGFPCASTPIIVDPEHIEDEFLQWTDGDFVQWTDGDNIIWFEQG